MKGKVKHPRIMQCSLCGQRYAVLNSTLHVSSSYRIKFCQDCTQILLAVIRKMKVAIRVRRES